MEFNGDCNLEDSANLPTAWSTLVHVPNFGGLSGSEDRGGGDNSIQVVNFGRVGDKSFKEWRQKLGGWKRWVTTIFRLFYLDI